MARRSPLRRLAHRMLKRPLYVGNRVAVGTHHKTGTVWFKGIFQALCGQLALRFRYENGPHPSPGGPWDVFMSGTSSFENLPSPALRGVHVIRDPRDVIVSATHYHATADEPWLHVPQEDFGGMTYQEKLRSIEGFDDRLLFEMEHMSRNHIDDMTRFVDRGDDRFLTVRYEDMVVDYGLERFEAMFRFLGFKGPALGWCLVSAYRRSLFSGTVQSDHVRSGKPAQWPEYFDPIHAKRFEELFGDALSRLGYVS